MKIVLVALHLQKNVTFFFFAKLLPQMPLGVEWPCNVGKKVFSVGRVLEILFYRAGMCACRDERNGALADTLYRLHKSSTVST